MKLLYYKIIMCLSNWRIFQSSWNIEWISPAVNEGTSFSISLLIFGFICLLITLENVKKNLDLMCIYLRTNYIELLFISLLAICMFYLGTWLFKTHCPYVNWVVFLLLSFKKYYLDTRPYQYIIWKYFSPILWVALSLFDGALWKTFFFTLMKPILSIFSLISCIFGLIAKKTIAKPKS